MDLSGQTLLEGVSDAVILLLVTFVALAAMISYWAQTWSSRLMSHIHPSMESTVDELRRALGLRQAADGGDEGDIEPQPSTSGIGDAGDEEPTARASAPATCPICFGTARLPVETNCGHVYCCGCITGYWRYTRTPLESITCPVCRTEVSLLLAMFQPAAAVGGRDAEAVGHMHEYNRRFSGQPRPVWDHVRDLPVLLPHLIRRLCSFDGLLLVFRARVAICLAAVVIYVLSPLDILPEALLGIFGFIDDFFVTVVMLVYATMALRQLVGDEAQ